ncbi:MAG: DUF5683 domain-containing protein [Bacteroidota bacterium]|nr:DUF5683 domain-containing protein [Bacteroidota bacterium]
MRHIIAYYTGYTSLKKRFLQRGRYMFAGALILCIGYSAAAQDTPGTRADTVIVDSRDTIFEGGPDTVAIESYAKRYSPRKAILYAAILPGLGQVYNKKYWKLPLVYGGFYAIGYGMNYYNNLHREYRGYLFRNLEDGIGENEENPNLEINLTTNQLRTIVDKSRRERDFMIILMGGMYILQMIDAHVDSHLKEFDLNPRLQVSIEPAMEQNALAGRSMGLALVVRF